MIRKIYFLLGLILGFVLCAHWEWGREFVQDISPVYQEPIEKGLEKVRSSLDQTKANLEKKVKEEITKEK